MSDISKEHTIEHCLSFLENHEYGVLSTVSDKGEPEAATITYAVDRNFRIYFATRRQTRKFKNLQNNTRVALVVGTGPEPRSVQIEGEAELLEGEEHRNIMVDFLVSKESYYNVFLKLPGLDLAAFKIIPTWVRMLDADAKLKEEKYTQVI